MGGIAFDGGNQVGNQVRTALILVSTCAQLALTCSSRVGMLLIPQPDSISRLPIISNIITVFLAFIVDSLCALMFSLCWWRPVYAKSLRITTEWHR